jgi:hypothetical protein
MAAIDKTYVTKKELLETIAWAKEVGEVSLENGYKFYPLNFICSYNDIDNIEDKDMFNKIIELISNTAEDKSIIEMCGHAIYIGCKK